MPNSKIDKPPKFTTPEPLLDDKVPDDVTKDPDYAYAPLTYVDYKNTIGEQRQEQIPQGRLPPMENAPTEVVKAKGKKKVGLCVFVNS